MADSCDIVQISGLTPLHDARRPEPARRFLSVWYRCCHTYGRLYRNRDQTAYVGRCPRCGAQVTAGIGPGGTSRRCFEAQ